MSKFNEHDFKCILKITSTVLQGKSPPVNSSLFSGSFCILFLYALCTVYLKHFPVRNNLAIIGSHWTTFLDYPPGMNTRQPQHADPEIGT